MINLFICSLFLLFSISSFRITYLYDKVSHAFDGFSKAVPESCVILVDIVGEFYPGFDEGVFKVRTNDYFSRLLGNEKAISYQISFFSYSSPDLVTFLNRPTGMTIHFVANISNFGSFDKIRSFEIRKT